MFMKLKSRKKYLKFLLNILIVLGFGFLSVFGHWLRETSFNLKKKKQLNKKTLYSNLPGALACPVIWRNKKAKVKIAQLCWTLQPHGLYIFTNWAMREALRLNNIEPVFWGVGGENLWNKQPSMLSTWGTFSKILDDCIILKL